jgi:hypothetical protein
MKDNEIRAEVATTTGNRITCSLGHVAPGVGRVPGAPRRSDHPDVGPTTESEPIGTPGQGGRRGLTRKRGLR